MTWPDWNWGDLVMGILGGILGWLAKILHGKNDGGGTVNP